MLRALADGEWRGMGAVFPCVKEGMKTPALPELGMLHTHVYPALEKTGHYLLEVPATYTCRGIDKSLDAGFMVIDKTVDATQGAVEWVKGIKLSDIKIKTLFSKKDDKTATPDDKTKPADATPPVLSAVSTGERATAAVSTESNRTGGSEAVSQMIASGTANAPVKPEVTVTVIEAGTGRPLAEPPAEIVIDAALLGSTGDEQREQAPADGGGFSGTADAQVLESSGSKVSMAQTLNIGYADFFEQKFESIKQAVAFDPSWLGDDQLLDAMYNDEGFRNQLKPGFQMRCVDTIGRKVIATGTSAGPVIVYQSNPNSAKLLMHTPAVFRRTHWIRSQGTTLDPSEYEIVLGSIDGKTTCNIGKAHAQLTQDARKRGI
jgi:hypothetical protein